MRAFVTGATGFVGGHLVDALLEAGHTVSALVRSPRRGSRLAERGVRLVEGDLSDLPTLKGGIAGHDCVFHVAGLVAARSQTAFMAVNRDGTARLVAAASDAAVPRFVLVSSAAAGGPSGTTPHRGDEPPHPVTQYGRSKLAAERVVHSSALAWTIVRPPAVYGPGDREMLRLFRTASMGFAPVFGNGAMQLSLVYAQDLARALVSASTSDQTSGHTYYAAHPEILSSRDVVSTIGEAAGRRVRVVPIPRALGRAALWASGAAATLLGRTTVLTADKANELFQDAWTCDPLPLTAATGWQAAFDLARGAAATVAWYREHRWL